MKIPNEAIEAALEAWGVGGQVPRNIVHAVLEAAAPHLMAQAWDEGNRNGYAQRAVESDASDRYVDATFQDDNPYRPANV